LGSFRGRTFAGFAFRGGFRLLEILEPQLQLFDLPRQLLRLPSKLPALELGQQQLEMFNLVLAGEQPLLRGHAFRVLCQQQGLQRFSI
jgi:hypothetical protein